VEAQPGSTIPGMRTTLALLFLLLSLPATAADDVETSVALMARIGSASAPDFSPDGRRVAFITNISGSPQVWTVAAEGGWPRQVTALDDPVTAVLWSPKGDWLAIEVAPGGGLNSQIHVVRSDGTGLRRLTDGGKENNWLARWTRDGKHLAISSNRRDGAAMDSWLIELASGALTLISKNPGIGIVSDVSRDGRYALVDRLRSRGDNDIYRVALDGSSEVHLTPHKPPALFNNARFGATSDEVYLVGNPDRDLFAFGRIRVARERAAPFEVLVAREATELDQFEIDDRVRRGVLSWNIGGRNELTFLDLESMNQTTGPKLPADIAGGFEFTPDGERLALALSGSAAPQDIWVMNTATGTLAQLTFSPHAGVDLRSLVRPELVSYTAHDGLQLSGWFYRPREGKTPYPTVFSFHGGPEGQERPTLSSTYQALLANGIAVFAPNVRGSAGFGKRFVNLDNGALRVGSVRDIKSSVDQLVERGLVDPKRVGIMGGSYGGYMVMAGLTEFPELFAAGANLFGIINFDTFFKHSEPWMAAISTVEYGDPVRQADMLRTLSPIHKIDRIRTPLLVLHGANDTNVPVIEAEQTVESLKKRNVAVEYILFPDEGHGWRKIPNRIRSTVSIVKFFRARLTE
jgi:dipeptidyl aminopeptidase/acylaminoacyl peptidase